MPPGYPPTSELVVDFIARGDQVPRIGSHRIACDGDGEPRIMIRSTELRIGPLTSADAAFARGEGEHDLGLRVGNANTAAAGPAFPTPPAGET